MPQSPFPPPLKPPVGPARPTGPPAASAPRPPWPVVYKPPAWQTFRSPRGTVKPLVVTLWVAIAVEAAVGIHALVDARMLTGALDDPDSVTQARLDLSDTLVTAGLAAQALVHLVAAILFLVWFGRASANLTALGRPGRPAAWAVLSWFVPVAAWVVPKAVVNDLWRAGERRRDRPRILDAWWAAWIAAVVLSGLQLGEWLSAEELRAYRSADRLELAASVATIAAALLCMRVVRAITARQEERGALPWTAPERPFGA